MKLIGDISSSKRDYKKGTHFPGYWIYPFFLFHMGMFGVGGFLMAYGESGPVIGLYCPHSVAFLLYIVFYVYIFGRDEVKWMFINSGLGLLGIYSQIDWILSFFGKKASDYPFYIHVIPFLYYILYTFMIRQAVLDIFKAREDEIKRKRVERAYVVISIAIYGIAYFLERR